MADQPSQGWVHITDPKVFALIELLQSTDGGVFLLTIHKKRLVKVQPMDKTNLLEVVSEQNRRDMAGS